MRKFIVLGVVVLNLALVSPCLAMQAVPAAGPAPAKKSVAGRQTHTAQPSVQTSIENVFVDMIEEGAIYSKDGRKFETTGVKVFDNTHKKTRRIAAELFFENGELVKVVLK